MIESEERKIKLKKERKEKKQRQKEEMEKQRQKEEMEKQRQKEEMVMEKVKNMRKLIPICVYQTELSLNDDDSISSLEKYKYDRFALDE